MKYNSASGESKDLSTFISNNGSSILHLAIQMNSFEMISLLVEKYPKLIEKCFTVRDIAGRLPR